MQGSGEASHQEGGFRASRPLSVLDNSVDANQRVQSTLPSEYPGVTADRGWLKFSAGTLHPRPTFWQGLQRLADQ